eukprot:TRINITY_DN6706_c0_g5_i1.p1 TRINITY_DN6706_c0_g5~~TRINITY_DN6706_c0_g5_i1.p1  ORF type:complete len:370 (-),score=51.19 TRINITY_DN6706_c0_g5_i1:338-1447(-)
MIVAFTALITLVVAQYPNIQNPIGFRYVCDGGMTVALPRDEVDQYKNDTGAIRGPCRTPVADILPDPTDALASDEELGYSVFPITKGAYWVAIGNYQVMFVVSNEGVIMVDCPAGTSVETLYAAIASVTDQPLTHIIYSHSHADHVAGCSEFPSNLTYIGSAATQKNFDAARTRKEPYGVYVGGNGIVPKNPDIIVEDKYIFTLGNQTLELRNEMFFHSDSDLLVYARQPQALMLVDVTYPKLGPFKLLAFSGNPKGILEAHDLILAYDANTYLSGHYKVGSKEEIQELRDFMYDLFAYAEEALQQVSAVPAASELGFSNPWNTFNEYFEDLVEYCAVKVLDKWAQKLQMLDVFIGGHCLKAITALRID